MNRTDSAFDESFRPRQSQSAKRHAYKNTPSSKKDRSSKPQSPRYSSKDQPAMKASKTPPATATQPKPQQKSTASSTSSSATKSRKRNNPGSSHPSSRRTSCTIIDPSRPARHYRIKSAQTCPTLNGDVDDVLALHFRACSIFQNPSYQSSSLPNSPPRSSNGLTHIPHGLGEGRPSIDATVAAGPPGLPRRAATTDFVPTSSSSLPPTARPETAPSHLFFAPHHHDTRAQYDPPSPTSNEQTALINLPASSYENAQESTMYWNSPTTRHMQYAEIDRETTGVRGFVRRILPRCVSGPTAQGFYEKDSGGDGGSVRRYRVELAAADDDDDEHAAGDGLEKEKEGLRMQRGKLERLARGTGKEKERKWGCF
ncbi:unnamed protein product [Periconia digitata]|uniref:Uncharacterized protein n=1 Tax=Periconia digitata TaxID=1303443 RepID=A0A9W4XP08_9PLEO|nr:unnamed protein product [Periconia digitata]